MRHLWLVVAAAIAFVPQPQRAARTTVVSIQGREFRVNGRPTYAGRSYDGTTVQGLLFNSRMVQGIFDDRNPETRRRWAYPDGPWDPERNTREFIAAMPLWKAKGCWPSRSTSRAAARRIQPVAAVGEFVVRDRRHAAGGLHVAAGAHPQSLRRTGHGRDRRFLLPGAGAADGRRRLRHSRGRRTRPTG